MFAVSRLRFFQLVLSSVRAECSFGCTQGIVERLLPMVLEAAKQDPVCALFFRKCRHVRGKHGWRYLIACLLVGAIGCQCAVQRSQDDGQTNSSRRWCATQLLLQRIAASGECRCRRSLPCSRARACVLCRHDNCATCGCEQMLHSAP